MQKETYPALFGLSAKTNRDSLHVGKKTHWGKNEFNSSFPTSLLCYMHSKGLKPIYIKAAKKNGIITEHSFIEVLDLFKIDPLSPNAYFAFEEGFSPNQKFIHGSLQRSDIVVMNTGNTNAPHLSSFEIKLTALPDSSTYMLEENMYSCEMVFRPTAISQLALSIAEQWQDKREKLRKILSPVCGKIYNWRVKTDIGPHLPAIVEVLSDVLVQTISMQAPFIIQPIWKTKGKANILSDNCLDVFVWSNVAFTQLFFDFALVQDTSRKMTRQLRCVAWLSRLLYDFSNTGVMNPSLMVNEMAYELQTDKAFSISGKHSWRFLNSPSLEKPRITKMEIGNIILGGGQNQLSPERRFDAAIVNAPEIFTKE